MNLIIGRVGTFKKKELKKAGADRTVKTFKEVNEIIKKLKGRTYLICDWDGTIINTIGNKRKPRIKITAAKEAIKGYMKVNEKEGKRIMNDYLKTSGMPFITQTRIMLKNVFKKKDDVLAEKIRKDYYKLIYKKEHTLFADASWLKKINEKAIIIISSSTRHKELKKDVKKKLGFNPELVLGAWGSFKKGRRHYKHIQRILGKADNVIVIGDTTVDIKEWKKALRTLPQ